MFELIVQWVQTSEPVVALRTSIWLYPVVNTAHLLGIALLVGGIVPLDLRLLGAYRSVPMSVLAPVLLPVVRFGFALTVIAGFALWAVRADEYLVDDVFRIKLVLILLALINIGLLRRGAPWRQALHDGPIKASVRAAAAGSMVLWLAVLFAGRLIGYR